MSDPFLDAEASREDSDAVELYAITVSTGQAYYLTSAIRDIAYDGRTYKATAIDRGEVADESQADARDMELRLAIDHPLVQRWTTYGVPPKRTTVVCYRLQLGVGIAEPIWGGNVTSLGWDEKGIARLRIPGRMSDALARKLPNVACSPTCTHVLYDANCGVSKTGTTPGGLSHRVTTIVLSVDGRDVRVDLGTTQRNGEWARNGTIRHEATGETMTVTRQTDANPGYSAVAILTMQARIAELKQGDTVVIQRGCRNTIQACRDDFANVAKFSGDPHLPKVNPFKTGEFI